jgi:hypothetical protein
MSENYNLADEPKKGGWVGSVLPGRRPRGVAAVKQITETSAEFRTPLAQSGRNVRTPGFSVCPDNSN